MKKNRYLSMMAVLFASAIVMFSCQQDEMSLVPDEGLSLKATYTNCSECIDLDGSPVDYYSKTETVSLTGASRTVTVTYYNTATHMVYEIGGSKISIHTVTFNGNTVTSPWVIQEPLAAGWEACDPMSATIIVTGLPSEQGGGTPKPFTATFNTSYNLVGICTTTGIGADYYSRTVGQTSKITGTVTAPSSVAGGNIHIQWWNGTAWESKDNDEVTSTNKIVEWDFTPTAVGTYKFRAYYTGGGNGFNPSYSSEIEITVTAPTPPVPTAILTGTQTICLGSSATLSVALTGTAPWSITYTYGTTPVTISSIATSPHTFQVSPIITTTYTLTAVTDANYTVGGAPSGTAVVTVQECDECETWQHETAFGGDSSGDGKAWWYIYDGSGSETIWAGQDIDIGTVEKAGGKIVITLTGGWELDEDTSEPVKIQGYNTPPTNRPVAGQFDTYKGDSLEPTVGTYSYYVIHLDVRKCMDN